MKERIKLLRHTLSLTQQKFADRLGIKGNAISQYESGRNAPIDAVISLICREFNVNEEWLRTGAGEMFRQTEETAIARLCAELRATELEASIIRAYFRIDPQIRDSFMRRLIQEVKAERGPAPAPAEQAEPAAVKGWKPMTDEEIAAELEDYRKELLAEREAAARSSALPKADGA